MVRWDAGTAHVITPGGRGIGRPFRLLISLASPLTRLKIWRICRFSASRATI